MAPPVFEVEGCGKTFHAVSQELAHGLQETLLGRCLNLRMMEFSSNFLRDVIIIRIVLTATSLHNAAVGTVSIAGLKSFVIIIIINNKSRQQTTAGIPLV